MKKSTVNDMAVYPKSISDFRRSLENPGGLIGLLTACGANRSSF